MKNKFLLRYLQNFCKYKNYLKHKDILNDYEINYFQEVVKYNLENIKKQLNF